MLSPIANTAALLSEACMEKELLWPGPWTPGAAFPQAIAPTPSAEICSHSQLAPLAMIPLKGASLFLQMLPMGPLQTECNLWGPGPGRG